MSTRLSFTASCLIVVMLAVFLLIKKMQESPMICGLRLGDRVSRLDKYRSQEIYRGSHAEASYFKYDKKQLIYVFARHGRIVEVCGKSICTKEGLVSYGADISRVYEIMGIPEFSNQFCAIYRLPSYRLMFVFRDDKVIAVALGDPKNCVVQRVTGLESEWFQ